jgi:hypothetical protein
MSIFVFVGLVTKLETSTTTSIMDEERLLVLTEEKND